MRGTVIELLAAALVSTGASPGDVKTVEVDGGTASSVGIEGSARAPAGSGPSAERGAEVGPDPSGSTVQAPEGADLRPSAAFRLHHREYRTRLAHLDRMVGRLPTQEEHRRRDAMREIVARLEAWLPPHGRAEEAALYPAVDRRVGGREPFTATMRREHRVVERWIAELDREASRERPDPRTFARLANRLLGLVEAHFEGEEEVLLDVLDRTMTAQEFQDEVANRMPPLHETLPPRPSPAGHRPTDPVRTEPATSSRPGAAPRPVPSP